MAVRRRAARDVRDRGAHAAARARARRRRQLRTAADLRGGEARRALGNLAPLLAALAAVLVILEGVLRLFGLASPVLFRIDSDLGYEPLPSQVSSRLGVRVHINDAGLRDGILVVGNSVTYGSSLVSQDQPFTGVLERRLRAGGAA